MNFTASEELFIHLVNSGKVIYKILPVVPVTSF